jgi:hypothetical protein
MSVMKVWVVELEPADPQLSNEGCITNATVTVRGEKMEEALRQVYGSLSRPQAWNTKEVRYMPTLPFHERKLS